MDKMPFCIDKSCSPKKITMFYGDDAPAGLDRHEFLVETDLKDALLKAASELYPSEEFVFGEGF
ncbi:hypothetical protein SAMN04515656_104114 [Eubacterium aggregans]|uniref:Uncharacterized protein n=1 Tax=Eubacterium aggregans TaxID=81409 RepID=A0A1H3YUG0_9FIRM|nr:hypothetical protein [Eubacterium aggregans]SEA15050.1 hypothetical protein SAMN04515656_104114 [Eubacterium aggregans]